MELRLSKEGVQYVLGLPVKDNPSLFSQVILSAGELEWLPSEVTITGFSSIDDAQRAKDELRNRFDRSPSIYQMTINRLLTEQVQES